MSSARIEMKKKLFPCSRIIRLNQNSTKKILAKAKELNILATASVMQSVHAKLVTSIQIESIQRELVARSKEL